MNHRLEGDGRQKRKIYDAEYGPGIGGNDLSRFTRRRIEHPPDGTENNMTEAPVDSGQGRIDSGKATTTVVVTAPDASQNVEW